jgi:hypothetical protein
MAGWGAAAESMSIVALIGKLGLRAARTAPPRAVGQLSSALLLAEKLIDRATASANKRILFNGWSSSIVFHFLLSFR